MTIQHYPQGDGGRAFRKEVTRGQRRTDDRQAGQPERVFPAPAKKDTRRWCRGKVGVPHRTEWQPCFTDGPWWHRGKRGEWWRLVCLECGRRMSLDWRWIEVQP